MEENPLERPRKVVIAITLFYIVLGINLIRGVVGLLSSPESIFMDFNFQFGVVTIFASANFFLLFLVYMIGKGRNWARITYLAFFVGGIPCIIPGLIQNLSTRTVVGVVNIGLYFVEIIALVLVFQKSSSDWFREMRAKSRGSE